MKDVKQILANKPANVYSVSPAATVFEALEEMMNKNISALVVLEDGQLKGIFTERDYARKIALKGKSSKDTRVSEIMTAGLITVSPSDTIDYCMNIMTERHIRHLPVVDSDKICGMVSIGDVVKSIIEAQQSTIQQLESYINSY
ncbi:CBS domain-containing protein [Paradesertivirga mongoliensis]|uniref:CBS domain-containing protein n=1 Tax=Paradesertivirga mongoliensis TaxID=2100740 RepID=A0ABW4ZJV0_9SPHI|nr:CBS domain-containing protein [Pedobacter mongoliensis]